MNSQDGQYSVALKIWKGEKSGHNVGANNHVVQARKTWGHLTTRDPRVCLVSKRKRGGANTVKVRDHTVKGSESVGERSRSGGGEALLRQNEGDVRIRQLPIPPLPFSSLEFTVATGAVVGLTVWREEGKLPLIGG